VKVSVRRPATTRDLRWPASGNLHHRCRSVERGSSSKADIPPADLQSCNTRGVDIDDPKAMTIFVRNLNGTLKRLARKEPRLVDETRDGVVWWRITEKPPPTAILRSPP
jgi:hypothetical protein